ncbi:MAG: redoxin domain-containing protein [Planctomycetes bacterium]|nr:redoxin domain-containing protein [Planctomycetota bacterium]
MRSVWRQGVRWLFVGCVGWALSAEPVSAAEPSVLGKEIANFQLTDFRGATHDLAEFKDRDLVVVAFLGTECPLARMYGPRLAELAIQFERQKVAFLAIDANQQDTLAEMAQYARTARLEFPFLKDPANAVADQFAAVRTPEVFVLDRQRKIRYRGRIDDQFGIGFSRPAPQRRDLAVALEELLAGRDVSQPETTPAGCHIGRISRTPPQGNITYARHIAPLLQRHCTGCHRPGEIGPFALQTHDDVVNWSATIREVVEEKRMPPWHTDAAPGTFVNDRRLSDDERKLLFDWIENGMPAGDSADLPEPPQYTAGWEIPQPDLVLEMPQPFSVPARGTVEYQYFQVGEPAAEDRWVRASEARPGNRGVVHHIILFFVPANSRKPVQENSLLNSIATFAPGMPAWQARPGMARRIPAGAKLYFQMHYTPNGAEQTDVSKAGLVFADPKEVEKELLTDAVVNFRLRIPPRTDNVRFDAQYGFGRDMRVVSMLPHMHLRGKAFRIESQSPDGQPRLLLDVPRYDFNWQNTYIFSQPVLLREGSLLKCRAVYDNSENNPANPDPSQTVGWGDQTWEEMLVAQFEAVLEEQNLKLGKPVCQPAGDDEFEVAFKYRPTVAAEAVYLAGSFNEWKPDGHRMDGPDADGNFSTRLKLKAGRYEYKFVVNGKVWRADPGNPDFAGDYANSVLVVGPSPQPAAAAKKSSE